MSKFIVSENCVDISAMFGIRITDPGGKLVHQERVTRATLIALAIECLKKAKAGKLAGFHLDLARQCIAVANELAGLKAQAQRAEMKEL